MTGLQFDPADLPFSRRGSWLSISGTGDSKRGTDPAGALLLRTARDRGAYRDILFLSPLPRGPAPERFTATATPSLLCLASPDSLVEICMPEPHIIRFRGRGAGLRLSVPPTPEVAFALPWRDGGWIFNSLGAGFRLLLRPLSGRLVVDAPWAPQGSAGATFDAVPDTTGEFDLLVEDFLVSPRLADAGPRPAFEEDCASVDRDFRDFRGRMPGGGAPRADEAAYVCWSSIVEPEGEITRPAMLMSKNRMAGVWSWDHCFNALALSRGLPSLARDQLLVIFDHQDEGGALPDAIFDRRVVWNFVKPPVHGWAIGRMLNQGSLDRPMIEEIYERLGRWTDFWFSAKDFDGDGVPQYDHGNDSGWDNASVFVQRPPIEAPELCAFLVIQMDTLGQLAEALGKRSAARVWRDRAAAFLGRALSHLTRGETMVPITSGSHGAVPSLSLLPYLQLLLGERLPAASRGALIRSLFGGGFLTEWGLATESTRSPLYRSDGYWLGPIWAPSTLLMVDALKACGEAETARDVAQRFLALAERSGFPENYDALTGEALRDRPFTWTASVYLLLADRLEDF